MRKFFNRFFGKGEKGELPKPSSDNVTRLFITDGGEAPKIPEISFPETEERLKRELQDGTVIAEELVRHVHKMGANGCNLYVEFSEGAIYCVSVKPVREREDA